MTDAPLTITEQRQTYVRADGTVYTREDIFIKLAVTFRDDMLRKLKGPRLSVFLCVALHCDASMTSFPSLATIGEETGYSHTAVINALKSLEGMGLVAVERRTGQDGGINSNLYTVRGFASIFSPPTKPSVLGVVNQVDQGTKPSVLGVVNLVDTKKSPIEEESIKEEKEGARLVAPSLPVVTSSQMFPDPLKVAQRLTAAEQIAGLAETHDRMVAQMAGGQSPDWGDANPKVVEYKRRHAVEVSLSLAVHICETLAMRGIPFDWEHKSAGGTACYWLQEAQSLARMCNNDRGMVDKVIVAAFNDDVSIKSPKSIQYKVADIKRSPAGDVVPMVDGMTADQAAELEYLRLNPIAPDRAVVVARLAEEGVNVPSPVS